MTLIKEQEQRENLLSEIRINHKLLNYGLETVRAIEISSQAHSLVAAGRYALTGDVDDAQRIIASCNSHLELPGLGQDLMITKERLKQATDKERQLRWGGII